LLRLGRESRRKNSCVSPDDTSDPLAPVFKEDGTESKHFPANLAVLFSYDRKSHSVNSKDIKLTRPVEKSKKLLEDYGLEENPRLEVNFNRFMNHIGEPCHCKKGDEVNYRSFRGSIRISPDSYG
jgi:hypothetical protein